MGQPPKPSGGGSSRGESGRGSNSSKRLPPKLVEEKSGGPRKIGSLISQLMSRRGYASVGAESALTGTIKSAVDASIASSFRVGKLQRGVLMIYAVDSVVMQELTFQKRRILKKLAEEHPQAKIQDLRFKVQAE
jgi:predicted nucleic acid-binding Zn ribbon protein